MLEATKRIKEFFEVLKHEAKVKVVELKDYDVMMISVLNSDLRISINMITTDIYRLSYVLSNNENDITKRYDGVYQFMLHECMRKISDEMFVAFVTIEIVKASELDFTNNTEYK